MGIVADIRRAEDDIMCDETTVCSYAALLQSILISTSTVCSLPH